MIYKQIVQKFHEEVLNERCYDNFFLYCHRDFTFKSNDDRCVFGLDAFADHMNDYQQAFPDLTYCTENMYQDGNCVIVYWKMKGTNKAPLRYYPATYKRVELTGCSFFRFKDGKIYENYVCFNEYEIPKQLGLLQNV